SASDYSFEPSNPPSTYEPAPSVPVPASAQEDDDEDFSKIINFDFSILAKLGVVVDDKERVKEKEDVDAISPVKEEGRESALAGVVDGAKKMGKAVLTLVPEIGDADATRAKVGGPSIVQLCKEYWAYAQNDVSKKNM
ncbi:hypothetical protein HK101_007942, partial [Irineochytrium annulatum]